MLPASGQDQACGPAGLPSLLSLVGASMISPSAFPAAASLGKVRWGDDSLYDNADEKGACRGLAISCPWNPWKGRHAPLRGTDGSSDLLPTMLRIRPAGRNLRYRHLPFLGAGHFPAIVVVSGIGDCP